MLVCLVAYLAVGYALGDSFTAWFERHLMRQQFVDVNGSGLMYAYRALDWDALRGWLRGTAVVAVGMVFTLVAGVGALCWHLGGRRAVERVERVMDDMASRDDARVECYPRAMASVAARVAELRGDAQRRERTYRDEAGRKNDLITYLAHDLKTPLASVVGYLNLLCDTPDMPAEQRAKCLDVTKAKADQLESLIEEFFDVARYSLQKIELQRTAVNLDLMLVQLVEEFDPLFAEHGNTARLAGVGGDVQIQADPERLARVFNNILKNAVAYSYVGSPIGISLERVGDQVYVSFASRGDTIPPGKLELIFEKFYRLDEARSGNTGGAGLGLAIAREIVDLHGGSIEATSADGLTTFTVVLPA